MPLLKEASSRPFWALMRATAKFHALGGTTDQVAFGEAAKAAFPTDPLSENVSLSITKMFHVPFAAVSPLTPLIVTRVPEGRPWLGEVIWIGLGLVEIHVAAGL